MALSRKQQIHFITNAITPKGDIIISTLIISTLDKFIDNKIFEQSSSENGKPPVQGFDVQKGTCQSCVIEIQLYVFMSRFEKLLKLVPEDKQYNWLQAQISNSAPGDRDATSVGKGRHIQQLSDSPSTQFDKSGWNGWCHRYSLPISHPFPHKSGYNMDRNLVAVCFCHIIADKPHCIFQHQHCRVKSALVSFQNEKTAKP